jgi:hypothetical protein
MVKLWEITEAQAEAMSSMMAMKVLAEQEEEDKGHGEAYDRLLSQYALQYDEDRNYPLKDEKGNFITWGPEEKPAPELWRYWEKYKTEEQMLNLGYGEALSLRPEVQKILEKKVAVTIGKFKSEASDKTKSKWEDASEERKLIILASWLKSKGHPAADGGRRKTRRRRRSTRAHTARRR